MTASAPPTVPLGRWLAAVLVCLVPVLLAVAPPFLGPGLRTAVMDGFHLVCHQLPARSFAVDGIPLAVCHRCFGVFAGLLGGALALPLLKARRAKLGRYARVLLLIAVLPLVLDWTLGVTGLWANTPLSRTATGVFFGLIAGVLFARALAAPAAEGPPLRNQPLALA